jgi:DNA-binding NarL/FixJ family response regulator
MVNVVDVEITLDNFQRAFGRSPSQEEIAMMMKLKALKQEKQINTSNTGNTMERSKKSQATAIERGRQKKLLKEKVKISPQAMKVNKMLNYGLDETQIADVLEKSVLAIRNCMYRYRLPRESVILDDKFVHHSELSGL